MGSLTRIAEQLLVQARKVDAYLEAQNLPPASFDEYNLEHLPLEIAAARDILINDSTTLRSLVELPQETTVNIAASWTDILTLRFLNKYEIARAIPLNGSASYAEIGRKVGLSENLVFRFIRHAMFLRFFDELSPGQVSHTFLSRRLATDQGFCDSIGLHAEDFTDASVKYIEALDKYGESGEPHETAFSLAHCSPGSNIFSWFGQNPAKAKRFGGAMQFYTSGDTWKLDHLYNAFDWNKWDKPDTVMIDVAGGRGHVTYWLAERLRNINFVVQDLPHVTTSAAEDIPKNFQSRIEFMAQNFLQPNKFKAPVDIVFLRWILHNWSDKYAIQILRNLIPVLKPGSKVLIYEFVLDDRPVKAQTDKMGHIADIIMEVGFAGTERTDGQYRDLVARSDERFVYEGVKKMGASSMSLVELTWRGDVKISATGHGINGSTRVTGSTISSVTPVLVNGGGRISSSNRVGHSTSTNGCSAQPATNGATQDLVTNGHGTSNGIGQTNGTNGLNGASVANGIRTFNGIDTLNGTRSTSTMNGTNGVNGTNGTNGTNGMNGTNGIQHTNGINGVTGPQNAAEVERVRRRMEASRLSWVGSNGRANWFEP